MIKIDFTIKQNELTFTDAIVLPDDHELTKTQIDAMKQARFDAWLAVVNTPDREVGEIE